MFSVAADLSDQQDLKKKFAKAARTQKQGGETMDMKAKTEQPKQKGSGYGYD